MKLVVMTVTYTAPLNKVEEVLAEHRDFLKEHYKKGWLCFSGPLFDEVNGVKKGGMIVAHMPFDEVDTFIKNDPFTKHAVATYRVEYVDPVLSSEAFGNILAHF